MCPICKDHVAPRADNPAYPFCSPRCQLADLSRWLDGSYRIVGEPAGERQAGQDGEDGAGWSDA